MDGDVPERFCTPTEILSGTDDCEGLPELVAAFGPYRPGDEVHRQLAWLAFFAVRRSLPCWDLYSDGDQPHRTLEVVRRWLLDREAPERWEPYTEPVQPTYRGKRIIDCTYSDTRAVSEAAAALARFCQSGDAAQAREALESAEDAFRFSPLWYGDHFRRWLARVALPAALQPRELSAEEQRALREYDAGEIAQEKEHGGMRPLTEQSLFREIFRYLMPRSCRSDHGRTSDRL